MFKITNISANPLTLSDGKLLAPGGVRKLKTVSDRDRGYEKHGWFRILDTSTPDQEAAPNDPQPDPQPEVVASTDVTEAEKPVMPETKKEGGKSK